MTRSTACCFSRVRNLYGIALSGSDHYSMLYQCNLHCNFKYLSVTAHPAVHSPHTPCQVHWRLIGSFSAAISLSLTCKTHRTDSGARLSMRDAQAQELLQTVSLSLSLSLYFSPIFTPKNADYFPLPSPYLSSSVSCTSPHV